jgi:lysophospholipase L1-like esterase
MAMLSFRLKRYFNLNTATSLVLLISTLVTQSALAAPPAISVSPTQGPRSSTVAITGREWPANDTIELSWNFNNPDTANAHANGNGGFTAVITVPSDAPTGLTRLNAINATGDLTAQAEFTVTDVNAGADLRPTAILYNYTELVPGRTVFFDSGIQNSGSSATEVFNIRWFVDGESVGYGSHAGVPANSTVLDGNSQYTWPATTGTHKIEFVVDSDNHVLESNESNNSRSITVTVTKSPEKYVALGDSFSSGEGAILYAWGQPVLDSDGNELLFLRNTDTEQNQCHRAPNAYPELAKIYFGISDNRFVFRACSGAIEAQFVQHWEPASKNSGQWHEPAQLDAIARDVDLITLSVGANDIGFAKILRSCIQVGGGLAGQYLHKIDEEDCLRQAKEYSEFGINLLHNGNTVTYRLSEEQSETTWEPCDINKKCVATDTTQTIMLRSLSDSKEGLFHKIYTRAPKAAIRVLLYPLLFEDIPDLDNAICKVGAGGAATISGKITKKLNDITRSLNLTIEKAVDKAKAEGIDIKAVPTADAFKGHRLCNNSEGEIQRPRKGSYFSFNSVGAWIHGLILRDPEFYKPLPFSFHPTAHGQEQVSKELIKAIFSK